MCGVNQWKRNFLWAWFLYFSLIFLKSYAKTELEAGKLNGWTVGGRKDAKADLIPSGPVLERLRNSRQFTNASEGKSDHFTKFMQGSKKMHLLQVSSDGYLNATFESEVSIEEGKQYEVSLISLSRNGGEAIYYFDVYAIGKDQKFPLGTAQYNAQSEE